MTEKDFINIYSDKIIAISKMILPILTDKKLKKDLTVYLKLYSKNRRLLEEKWKKEKV